MTCGYCGKDNPDGTVYCSCGMPLTYERASARSAGGGEPFADIPQQPQNIGYTAQTGMSASKKVIISVIIILLAAAAVFGFTKFMNGRTSDESKWEVIDEAQFTINAPSSLKSDKMLTAADYETELLCFYTSFNVGFDVNLYKYTDEEKAKYGSYTAKEYLEAAQYGHRSINGQTLYYDIGGSGNYMYTEYAAHRPNYVSKSSEVWLVEATFPVPKGYYIVEVYCPESDKAELRDPLLKMLDSFTIKFPDDD